METINDFLSMLDKQTQFPTFFTDDYTKLTGKQNIAKTWYTCFTNLAWSLGRSVESFVKAVFYMGIYYYWEVHH